MSARSAATVAWRMVAASYALLTVAWLVRGLVPGAGPGYPADDVILDYLFSAAMLVLASVLLRRSARRWGHRMLGLGLIGAAGAYNVQAGAVNHDLALIGAVVLHAGGTALAVAGLLLLTGGSGRGFGLATALLAVCAGGVSAISAGYAPSLDFLFTLGILTPLIASSPLAGRTARLVRSASAALVTLTVLLVASTLVTRGLGTPGLLGDVPGVSTAGPQQWLYPPGLGWLGPQVSAFWVARLVAVAAFVAIVTGLVRRRPSEVDRVVGRAALYAILVAAVGAAYVIGVVRVDASFGLDSDWLAPPQVAAAALVALAFGPVRTLLERAVDRIVYGRRLTARQMVAQVATVARASSGGTEALRALAQLTAQTLATDYAIVHVTLPDSDELTCVWPEQARTSDAEWQIPLHHKGSTVGVLAVPAAGRRLPRSRRRLVADLSRSAGVIVHNTATSLDLARRRDAAAARSTAIRASRWRIVAAQDCERRDLERALHDVAQPALTAVRLTLGLVNHLAAGGDREASAAALAQLRDQIQGADAGLHRILRGIDPPVLTSSGVVAALREAADTLGADVQFVVESEVDGPRFGKHVEAAAFYCGSEALQNCVKHSPGAAIRVHLHLDPAGHRFCFTISDDGPGFEPTQVARDHDGGGLQNMADRVAAAGGDLVIDSAPGAGTRVSVTIPLT